MDERTETLESKKEKSAKFIMEAYDQLIENVEYMRAEHYRNNDTKSVENDNISIEHYKRDKDNLTAALLVVEMAQEKVAQNKHNISEVKTAIRLLSTLCGDEKSVGKSLDGLRSSFDSNSSKYFQSEKKEEPRVIEQFTDLSSRSKSRFPEQFKGIMDWAQRYSMIVPEKLDLEKSELLSQIQTSIQENTLSLDNQELAAVFSVYDDLPPEFKDNSINLKEVLEDIRTKDSLEKAAKIVQFLEDKLKSFTLEVKSMFGNSKIVDFASERAYLNEMQAKIRERVISLETKINKSYEVVSSKIHENSQRKQNVAGYSNAYSRYEELRTKISNGVPLTSDEKEEFQNLEYQMEQMEQKGKVSVDDVSEIQKHYSYENAMKSLDKKEDFTAVDVSIAEFKEQYPSEYAAIVARANEIVRQEESIGKFGNSYIENNPDKTNPEYESAMNSRQHELVVQLIEEFKKTQERHMDMQEAEEQHEKNVELFSIFGAAALDELRSNGVITTFTTPDELTPAELKSVFDMIDHYKAMASMTPEERALYRATKMPYKNSNGEMVTLIPERADRSEITLDTLTPMERIQFMTQMQIDQRHPEMDEMYGEYLSTLDNSKTM